MSGSDEMTTIAVRRSTRDRLYEQMRGKMTADEVLTHVLDLLDERPRPRGAGKVEAPASS
jgi:hypothetical protein